MPVVHKRCFCGTQGVRRRCRQVQSKRGVLKYPIEHGDNGIGIGMCKAESAGDDWLSDELQIDPIIDEPMEMTSPLVLEPMSFAPGQAL